MAVYGRALSAASIRAHFAARVPFRWGINANTSHSVRVDTPPNQTWPVTQMDKLRAGGVIGTDPGRPRILREVIPSEVDLDPARWDPYWRNAATRGFSILPVILPQTTTKVPDDPAVQAKAATVAAQYAARYGPGGTFWAANPTLPPALASSAIRSSTTVVRPAAPGLPAALRPAAAGQLPEGQGGAAVDHGARPARLPRPPELDHAGRGQLADRPARTVPNIADYFDAGAVHPYTTAGQDPATCNPATVKWCFQDIRLIRSELDELPGGGGAPRQLWITEMGISICPNDPALCTTEGSYVTGGAPCASAGDRSQVCVTSRAIEASRALPYVDAYVHYAWEDRSDPGGADEQRWFGLVRVNGTRKPAGSYTRDRLRPERYHFSAPVGGPTTLKSEKV